MAHLKITTPEGNGIAAGFAARLWLNGEEISQYVSGFSVTASAENGPVQAHIDLYVSRLDMDITPEVTLVLPSRESVSVIRS